MHSQTVVISHRLAKPEHVRLVTEFAKSLVKAGVKVTIEDSEKAIPEEPKKPRLIRRPTGMLFPQEAADTIGQSEPTLRAWRAEGRENQPDYFKIGGHVWYREQDLLDWIELQRISPSGVDDEDGDD